MSRSPRVCLITQWFPPEPAFVAEQIADTLQSHGWEVDVLTGHPNYPEGRVYAGYGPAWRVRRAVHRKSAVLRVPLYPNHDESAVRRMANYASWSLSAAIFGWRMLRRADVCLVYASPATAAFPAMLARRLFGVPVVLIVQDLWPDSVISSGFLSSRTLAPVRVILNWYTRAMYRQSTHVVAISPGMLELLRSRGVPSQTSSLVYNWSSEEVFTPRRGRDVLRQELGIGAEDFLLMYAGNHGPAQALDVVVEAVREGPESWHLLMMGEGISKEDLMAQARECPRIHFMPSTSQHYLAEVMPDADAHLVALASAPVFDITVPSKIQNIMAAGLPMLVVAQGDAARIVTEAEAGISVPPGDSATVYEAIDRLQSTPGALPQMGSSARSYYDKYMSRAIGGARLHSILLDAARAAPGAPARKGLNP